jgi:hypothetical protein
MPAPNQAAGFSACGLVLVSGDCFFSSSSKNIIV